METMRMLSRIFSLDTLIYLAIAAVLLGSMLRCFIPLMQGAARLRKAARIIVTENKQNREKRSWNDLHFLGEKMSGIWADFLQNAERRDAHGESCDVSQYINEDTVIYAGGSTRLAEIVPGILVSLGILGTFLGLVTGLSGLNLSATDTSTLLSGMEKLVSGMSTAFLTSIAGVLASLVFNMLNNHYMTACQRAIDRFCDVFSLYAMPKPVSAETEMLSLAKEQTEYIRQAVEDVSRQMAVQMEQSIMRAMLPVQRSMDNFIVAATQAQVEGVDRIAQVFVQRMNVALGQEFEHLRSVIADTGVQQHQARQEMMNAVQAIGQMTQDVINMHQLSQGVLEHFKAYVTDMDASRAQVDDTNRRTLELLEAMNKTSGQQALYLAKLQEYQAALTANQQQYTVWTDQFLANAQEQTRITQKEMERVVEKLHDGSEALTGAYAEFAARIEKSLAGTTALYDETITHSIARLNETLVAMRETTQLIPQLMSQSRDRYAQQVDQFVEALVRLQKGMDRLADAAREPGKE